MLRGGRKRCYGGLCLCIEGERWGTDHNIGVEHSLTYAAVRAGRVPHLLVVAKTRAHPRSLE